MIKTYRFNKLWNNGVVRIFRTNQLIQVLAILQGVILARSLGAEGRGDFANYFALMNSFASFLILGMNISVLHEELNGDYISLTLGRAIRSSIFATLSMLSLNFFGFYVFDFFTIILVAIFVLINHWIIQLHAIDLRFKELLRYNMSRNILNPSFLCGIGILFLVQALNVKTAITALLVSNIFSLVFRLLFRENLTINLRILGNEIISLKSIRKSLSFSGYSISESFVIWGDKLLLIFLFEKSVVGHYMVALSSASLGSALFSAFSSFSISEFTNRSEEDLYVRTIEWYFKLLLSAVIICGVLFFLVPKLIPVFYGKDFSVSSSFFFYLLPLTMILYMQNFSESISKAIGLKFSIPLVRTLGFILMAGFVLTCEDLGIIPFIQINIGFSLIVALFQVVIILNAVRKF